MSGIQLNQFSHFFAIAVNLRRHAMDDIPFAVLVDHIEEIIIREEINIEHIIIIRQIVLVNLINLLHVIIQDSDPVSVPDILIYEEIAIDLANNLEIQASCIILFRF